MEGRREVVRALAARNRADARARREWVLEIERRKTLPLEQLPSGYTTIYLLSTFDPPMLEAAASEGLVRPDLRRAELIAWKQSRAGGSASRAALEAKREKLLRELRQIEAQLSGSGGTIDGEAGEGE